jgi:hypothetical protein
VGEVLARPPRRGSVDHHPLTSWSHHSYGRSASLVNLTPPGLMSCISMFSVAFLLFCKMTSPTPLCILQVLGSTRDRLPFTTLILALCLLYIRIFIPLQSINESKRNPRGGSPSFGIICDLRNLLFHNLQGTKHPRQVKLREFELVVIAQRC